MFYRINTYRGEESQKRPKSFVGLILQNLLEDIGMCMAKYSVF